MELFSYVHKIFYIFEISLYGIVLIDFYYKAYYPNWNHRNNLFYTFKFFITSYVTFRNEKYIIELFSVMAPNLISLMQKNPPSFINRFIPKNLLIIVIFLHTANFTK